MKNVIQLLKRNFYIVLFLALEAVSLSMFLHNSQQQESRFYDFCTGVKGLFLSVGGDYRSRHDLQQENDRLQRENAWLRANIETSYLSTSHRTDTMNGDTLYRQMYVYMPARIISGSIHLADNYFLLDAGYQEGVEPGMAVISPNGIVGIVNQVSRYFCSVISVLHHQSMISAALAESGHSGSLTWPGTRFDEALLTDIPSHIKVRIGDRVVTSGLSIVYPGGIPVGFVSDILLDESGDFYRLKVRFSEDYTCVDKVYIIKNLFKEDMESCNEPFGKI